MSFPLIELEQARRHAKGQEGQLTEEVVVGGVTLPGKTPLKFHLSWSASKAWYLVENAEGKTLVRDAPAETLVKYLKSSTLPFLRKSPLDLVS